MELEEDEHRKENEKKERDVKNYKHQLETIQQQYDALQEEMQSQVDLRERDFFGSAMNMQEDSQEIIARLESRIVDLEGQVSFISNSVKIRFLFVLFVFIVAHGTRRPRVAHNACNHRRTPE